MAYSPGLTHFPVKIKNEGGAIEKIFQQISFHKQVLNTWIDIHTLINGLVVKINSLYQSSCGIFDACAEMNQFYISFSVHLIIRPNWGHILKSLLRGREAYF